MAPISQRTPRVSMYIYPWDVHGEGLNRTMDTLQACGVSEIILAASYHIGTYVLPRNPVFLQYYGDHGAVYFEPDRQLYKATCIEPYVSQLVNGRRYLTSILECAARGGIRTTAWIVYCYNHQLARNFTECGKKNIFGDQDHAQLCVANPNVREYAAALTKDILSMPFDGLFTESLGYLSFGYGFVNPKVAITIDPDVKKLLGLCFCPHCVRLGEEYGIDMKRLSCVLRDGLRHYLNELPDGDGLGKALALLKDPELNDQLDIFLRMREGIATSILVDTLQLARSLGKRTTAGGVFGADPKVTGVSDASIAPHVDEIPLNIAHDITGLELATMVKKFRRSFPKQELNANIAPGNCSSISDFQDFVSRVLDAGFEAISFYNYGLFTRRHLEWFTSVSHI